jgi:O-antigen ligase
MQRAVQGRLQDWFVTGAKTQQVIAIILLCLIVGITGGAFFAFLGPILAVAVLGATVVGLAMLRSTQLTFFAMVGLICLLPFASVPMPDIGFSPTFLDLAFAVLLVSWLFQVALKKKRQIVSSPLGMPIIIFMVLACASFVFGLSFANLTTNLIRHFVELLLNIFLFFLVLNNVDSRRDLEEIVTVLILAASATALIGIVLYYLPQDLTVRLLSALRVFRYPAGSDVLRFVEDDPELPLRATSTSIDPNVLGGLLGIVGALAAPQLLAKDPLPLLHRGWRKGGVNWLIVPMLAVMGICLLLTYSRAALGGLAAALLVIALLRYRRLLLLVLVAGALLLLLPQTQWYVQRMLEGLRGQDLATQMRFGEYKDALILISRYPWFGVGFAGAPDIDTYIGVSNVYLLIAEEMGVVGLAVFLWINALGIKQILHWLGQQANDPRLEAIVLGLLASLLAALFTGTLDHYYFNINFQHAVALFWLCLGLAVRGTMLPAERASNAGAAERAL